MKKKVILILLSLLLIGVTIFAAGDLQVNGRLGVGVTPGPGATVGFVGGSDPRVMEAGMTVTDGSLQSYGMDFGLTRSGSNNLTNDVAAFTSNINFADSGDRTISGFVSPVRNNIRFLSGTSGTSTITSSVFTNSYFSFVNHASNIRSFNVNSAVANIIARGHVDNGSAAAINYSDLRNIWVQNSSFINSAATSLSGIWIDAISGGTNNFGIVLDGDGAGADIVFGPTQSARIYSSAGRLYAQDSFGNQTILSPHDPETGEWIFYSKNIKTGVVKRVNMEKLVKAVEKLTGEKFMVETLEEGD